MINMGRKKPARYSCSSAFRSPKRPSGEATDSINRFPHRHYRSSLWNRIVTSFLLPLTMQLWTQALVVALLVSAVQAQSPKRLWVLQEPDRIVEYDVTTFAARRTVKVPRRLLEHPEYLSINGKGQMVFLPPHGVEWASGEMAFKGDRVWFWDGHQDKEWSLERTQTRRGSAGKLTLTEKQPRFFLSARGEFLFWFENTFEKVTDELGLDRSVRVLSRVWRTDLAHGKPETMTTLSLPGWCRCETGTCSETCPEWDFWAPDGVVDDFFLVTRLTPGQLGSTYHESFLYRRSGQKWRVNKLAQPIERPLAASRNGEVLIAAVPDGGCCGWENESNDQLVLLKKGKISVLYDEFERYANRNYDVSFYTADARLAPGNRMVAYTVVSTARTDSQIRLSSEGKENIEELARVRKAIAELPAVVVVQLGIQPRSETIIRHAALVGWLNEREILVAGDGQVTVYDICGSKRRETPIRVRSAADAFLR